MNNLIILTIAIIMILIVPYIACALYIINAKGDDENAEYKRNTNKWTNRQVR